MSIRTVALVFAFALLTQASDASAGLFKGLGEAVGRGIGEGAVAKISPIIGPTLADVDNRLTAHEAKIGSLVDNAVVRTSGQVGVRLTQVDGILEKRLLQVQLGVDEVLDHGLDKIDGIARRQLFTLDGIAEKRIQQVDQALEDRLDQVDQILKRQVADVSSKVTDVVDHADEAIGQRIEQVDEVAGRRLGNVDVIATKQRLNLEHTVVRAAWLLGLVAFVVSALKAMWKEYVKADEALADMPPGRERAMKYTTSLGRPLLQHSLVAAVVAALLATVPEHLPMAARSDQAVLVASHASELERNLLALDFPHVRYHASQLELLDVSQAAHYQALSNKADLLRDLLERPTALATATGVASILERVHALERVAGRPDPDARTVRAMITWQNAKTRSEEQAAASLASTALWSSPRGFTLAPMAKLIIEAYLHAPVADFDDRNDLTSAEGMRAVLSAAKEDAPGTAFEGLTTLFRLMQALDTASSAAYVAMVEAQARVADPKLSPVLVAAALKERNAHAQALVKAWEVFDASLRDTPSVRADALVLSVFRINDVPLSHALWFTTDEATREWPTPLLELGAKAKLALAPARAVWARRYAALLEGPARELILLQEADRFRAFEQDSLAFEQAYAAWRQGPVVGKATPKSKQKPAPAPVATADELQLNAAAAAAKLGLYEGPAGKRTPLAQAIAGQLVKFQTRTEAKLDDTEERTGTALEKFAGQTKAQLSERVAKAQQSLRDRLSARGPRLM